MDPSSLSLWSIDYYSPSRFQCLAHQVTNALPTLAVVTCIHTGISVSRCTMGIMIGLTQDISVRERAVTWFRSGTPGCNSSFRGLYPFRGQRTRGSGLGPATANRNHTGNGCQVGWEETVTQEKLFHVTLTTNTCVFTHVVFWNQRIFRN